MQTSIVNYKDLNYELRIDAEYYRAEVLNKINLLDKKENSALSGLASFVIGPFGSTVTVDQYVDRSKFRYIRNRDISDFQIADNDPALIPEQVYKALPQFHIKENDLLVTVVGTLGKVAIATKKDTSSIFSCKSTIIRTNKVDPFYLLAYLNSNIGQIFAQRGVRGAIQQGLNLSDLKEIKVFIPSESFQKSIRILVEQSFVTTDKAKSLYSQAEQILLSELSLLNWKPKRQLSFIKHYSDTQSADRIDAEYFQPMYEEMEAILSKRNRKSIESICSLINYGTVPTSPYAEKGIPYIKGLNLVDGIVQGEVDFLENTNNLPNKFYTKKHDIIISQMGTVGKAGLVLKDQKGWLFASFTIRIRLKDTNFINPYVLTLYINRIAREWYLMRKIAQASVRQNTDLPTIRNLQVPEIANDIQNKITSKIIESYELKTKAKRLLNIAKRGVELAIEKSEKEALEIIKGENINLEIM